MEAKNITVENTEAFSTNEVIDLYLNRTKIKSNDFITGYSTDICDYFDSFTGGIPKIGLTIIDGNRRIEEFIQTIFFKFVARKELKCVYYSLREKLVDLFLIKQIVKANSTEYIEKFKVHNPVMIEGNIIHDEGYIEELFDQPIDEGAEVIFLDSLNNIYNPSNKEYSLFDFFDLVEKINNLAKQNKICIIATLHRNEKKNPLERYPIKDNLLDQKKAYEMLMFVKGYREGYLGTIYHVRATKPDLHYYSGCVVVSDILDNEFDKFVGIDEAFELSWKKNWTSDEKLKLTKEIFTEIHLNNYLT